MGGMGGMGGTNSDARVNAFMFSRISPDTAFR
jgi:hypothetical protein